MRPLQALISAKVLTDGLSLRRREKRDAEDLWSMFHQPLCRQGAILEPFDSAAELQAWLDSMDGHFDTVATVGDRAIGMGGLYLGAGNQSHIGTLTLFIHDDFHRRRIGTLMMYVLLSTADILIGIRRVQLLVFCDNAAAISLYRKFGFEIDGRHESFARRGDTLLPVYSMARIMLDTSSRASMTSEKSDGPPGAHTKSANAANERHY
jgi:L-phenylalanine/L-methionine N-acetyltransferase